MTKKPLLLIMLAAMFLNVVAPALVFASPIGKQNSTQTEYFEGKVGIGTSSPSDVFHIYGPDGGTGASVQDPKGIVRFATANGVNYIQSGTALMGNSKADLLFTSIYGTTPWMAIQGATGNVGIGTTIPDTKLHVVGGTKIDGSLSINSGNLVLETASGVTYSSDLRFNEGGNYRGRFFTGGTDKPGIAVGDLQYETASGSTPLVIKNATGRVGVGTTSPKAPLHIEQDWRVAPSPSLPGFVLHNNYGPSYFKAYISDHVGAGWGWHFDAPHSDDIMGTNPGNIGVMSFGTGDANTLVINRANNIGVSDTTPTQKLDVNGTAIATDFCIRDASGNKTAQCLSAGTGGSGGGTFVTQEYATPGTYTWTVPAGVTAIRVRVWGAGGNGAIGSNFFQSGVAGAGGGGGGGSGGYVEKVVSIPAGTTSYQVVVGAGGGGSSSFGGTLLLATGGANGSPGSGTSGGAGGAGGVGSGQGTVNAIPGRAGNAASGGAYVQCSGGYGQAGSGGNGADNPTVLSGKGLGGVIPPCTSSTSVPTSASLYGAGGGGAAGYYSVVGLGAAGAVSIENYSTTFAPLVGWPAAIICGGKVHYLYEIGTTNVIYTVLGANASATFDKATRMITAQNGFCTASTSIDNQTQRAY